MPTVVPSIPQKQCSKCHKEKPTSSYYFHTRDGYQASCKECQGLQYKKQYRDGHLRRKFGLTLNKYAEMLLDQEGLCAICKIHQNVSGKALAVDLCHKTGKIRGLLCFKCNTAIGKMNDDIEMLKKAIAYLQGGN
jgi:hypothetical protein